MLPLALRRTELEVRMTNRARAWPRRGRESERHAMSAQVLEPMRRGSFPAQPEKVGRLHFLRMILPEAVLTHFNIAK
jgi:hypothetical protein